MAWSCSSWRSAACRPGPPGRRSARLERQLRQLAGTRGALALLAGALALLATRWIVAGIGLALLVLAWRTLGGAAGERRAMMRLEALATWTESLRDTIAGAVGLEQAIPSSLRVAAPSLQEPLARLVDRLHTRVPMPEALRTLADDLDDPSADLIIAALIINARLRGPGLRDLLGALSTAVREELDMRRKVNAERRSTRRSAQIVVLVSVGLALGLALLNPGYVHVYDSPLGQLVLVVVVALYAAGFIWMRRLATFDAPERLLTGPRRCCPPAPSRGHRGRGHRDRRLCARGRVMTAVLTMGAVVGLGLFLLIFALVPRRASLARQLAAFDAARPPMSQAVRRAVDERESEFSRRMGRALAAFCAEQGWEFPSLRANLSLIGKSFENYLATKVLLACSGVPDRSPVPARGWPRPASMCRSSCRCGSA